MSEVKDQVVEAEFQEVQEEEAKQEEVKVAAEITIQVLENGEMNLDINEEYQKLSAQQVEGIARSVAEKLQEQRIAAQALELFKSKLSF
jgi:hypothetical protein